MTKHRAIGRFSFALAILVGIAGTADARDFTIASWGRAYSVAQRDVYYEPFAKEMGIKYLSDTYLGGWAQFQAMQKTGVVNWDVVDTEASALVRGCEEGVFKPIDWSKLPPKSEFVGWAVSECGLGAVAGALVLAYNKNTIGAEVPTSAAHFFDLKKWPGKRAVRNRPENMLEFALLADGVAPKDMYKVLGTPAGVDRAFAKLTPLKPHIVWWEAGAQTGEWLMSGAVTMGIAYNGRMAVAKKEGLPLVMIWENALVYADYWAILKGTPYEDLAYKFLRSTLDIDKQIAFTERFPYEPPMIAATAKLKPEVADGLPVGSKLTNSLFVSTEEGVRFWQDNADALTQRWTTWRAN